MKLLWFLFLLGNAFGAEFFSDDSFVHLLHKTTFEKKLSANSTASIVLFYAPYCEHSKKLAPVYTSVAKSFSDVALFAAVDCSESINQALCRQFEITSFPTLKLFSPDEDAPDNNAAITYDGTRSAQGLQDALRELITDKLIHPLEKLEDLKLDLPQVLLFTEKLKPTLLYKSLSWRYRVLATFYECNNQNDLLISHYNISHFPTLLIIQADGKQTTYSGELNAPSLVSFLDELFNIKYKEEIELHLRVLHKHNFDQIDQDEEIWLIAFFSDPHGSGCSRSLQTFQKEIVKVEDYSRVGIFNISSDNGDMDLMEFEIKRSKLESNPCTLKVVRFPFGAEKSEKDAYEIYPFELEARHLQEFVFEAITITPTKLDEKSMYLFMNSEVPRPKIVLFSSHDTCPKLFAALAMSLRYWKADFGFVPMKEKTLHKQFQVDKIPTLTFVFFDPEAEQGKQVFAPKYQGPLQFGPMKGWIEALLFTLKIHKEDHYDPFFKAEMADYIQEIQNEEDIPKACNSSVPLCAFVVLDRVSEKFQTQLDWLGTFIVQKSNAPISFAWLDIHKGQTFVQEFGIGYGDIPSIVVYSPKKLRFAVLKHQFTSEKVEEFFYKVINGQEATYPIEKLPDWTDKEQEVDVAVEEIDLEEIMSVQLDNEKQTTDTKEEL